MALRSLVPARPDRPRPDVSLAIVNIVLLLIFFFLTTGSLSNTPTVAVQVSETYDLPIELLPQPIVILEEDGGFTLNGATVPLETVPERLAGEPTLHVMVARDASAHRLLDFLAQPEFAPFEIRLVTVHRRSGE